MMSNLNPLALIANLFFIGKIQHLGPVIATLIGLIGGLVINAYFGFYILLFATIAALILGFISAAVYTKSAGGPDEVVIDEIVGIWVTLLLMLFFNYSLNFGECFLVFMAYVILDFTKPWPAGSIDEYAEGSFGIMLDDVITGFYAFGASVIALFFYVKLLT